MEMLGKRGFQAIFADTGNEHPATLSFIDELPELTGGPPVSTIKPDLTAKFAKRRKNIIEKWPAKGVPARVIDRALAVCRPSGNPFLDLCLLRGGFPSTKRRYCTEILKIEPITREVVKPLAAAGRQIVSWQGVRAEESLSRRNRPMAVTEIAKPPGKSKPSDPHARRLAQFGLVPRAADKPNNHTPQTIFYPLLHWSAADVWRAHKEAQIDPNPLYRAGMNRVGCMPCIHSKKLELRQIARLFPEHIDKIEEWENTVALITRKLKPSATFFHAKTADPRADKDIIATDTHGIRNAVEWAKTGRGGTSYDLFAISGPGCNADGYCE